jgi:uncharacterized protein YjbI with pentapeptide repeats
LNHHNLAVMYFNGMGFTQDYIQAHMWVELSTAGLKRKKREAAEILRDEIARKMTSQQIVKAQMLAREWNRRRQSESDAPPEAPVYFSYPPNLSKADLSKANLLGANLTKANLDGANLSEADPCYSCLLEASLKEANLTRANLTKAFLAKANLTEANLTGANLTRANLTGANLTGTDMTRVIGLSQRKVNRASGDKNTKLPANLQKPDNWE